MGGLGAAVAASLLAVALLLLLDALGGGDLEGVLVAARRNLLEILFRLCVPRGALDACREHPEDDHDNHAGGGSDDEEASSLHPSRDRAASSLGRPASSVAAAPAAAAQEINSGKNTTSIFMEKKIIAQKMDTRGCRRAKWGGPTRPLYLAACPPPKWASGTVSPLVFDSRLHI